MGLVFYCRQLFFPTSYFKKILLKKAHGFQRIFLININILKDDFSKMKKKKGKRRPKDNKIYWFVFNPEEMFLFLIKRYIKKAQRSQRILVILLSFTMFSSRIFLVINFSSRFLESSSLNMFDLNFPHGLLHSLLFVAIDGIVDHCGFISSSSLKSVKQRLVIDRCLNSVLQLNQILLDSGFC